MANHQDTEQNIQPLATDWIFGEPMLIEAGTRGPVGVEKSEGQGQSEELQGTTRRAPRDMPLWDCTNTASLRIDQASGGKKLSTKG